MPDPARPPVLRLPDQRGVLDGQGIDRILVGGSERPRSGANGSGGEHLAAEYGLPAEQGFLSGHRVFRQDGVGGEPGLDGHVGDGLAEDDASLPYPRFTGHFGGETVLIVDDDVRNVFALTSVLEQRGLTVRYAENGREGIDVLERSDRVHLVLMDIMMPEMDGYATMRAIRRMDRFSALPIIALTAKAMQGDREKAVDAGASDYVTKPVDIDRLLALISGWLDADGDGRPVR